MEDSECSRNRWFRLLACARALRVRSWIGWLFIFGLGTTVFLVPTFNAVPFAAAFCLITASVFVLNQYFDFESDKLNIQKRSLPVASGALSRKSAFNLFLSLFIGGSALIFIADVTLAPLFLVYFVLWTLYSAPPFFLKGRPIIDIIVAGVGSGVLPFIIGLQVSHQLTFDFSSYWIRRRYQDALLIVLPIFLFQMAGQIFQTIGDVEADSKSNITTFAVKTGKEASARIGSLLIATCLFLPLAYGIFDLYYIREAAICYLLFFAFSLPLIFYLLNLTRTASESNLARLQKIAHRWAPLALLILYLIFLFFRILFK